MRKKIDDGSMMKKGEDMYDKMSRFMEGMTVGLVRQAKPDPINVGQHYGLSDLSGFQSMQVVRLLSRRRQITLSLKLSKWVLPMVIMSLRQQIGKPQWPRNLEHLISKGKCHRILAPLIGKAICHRNRREHHPGIYKKSPYMDLPPTTVLPKKQGGKSKNKGKEANVSPFNLGNAFNDEDVEGDDVMIPGEQDTGIYFTYENMDPNKVYMPISARGNHWVTDAINLTHLVFYMFDSLYSDTAKVSLE
uniref:Uncharacterized protein n=1 Tax=Tanacetum cinerariifolium TaxID=118510 RepID=A0A699JIG9_TANCI|nr:hypothetical protein [Tanacetum cinerariifolium]